MKTSAATTRSFEFCFPRIDTLVLVEAMDDHVVRTTRDTFAPERKACFIRELVAEGFIAEDLRWSSPNDSETACGVRWLVDFHWLKPNETMARRTMVIFGPPLRCCGRS